MKAGGKREGAGRKTIPYEEKKRAIRISFKNKDIDKLGGEEKLKTKIKNFINTSLKLQK